MALPTTGPISLGQVKEELNKTGSISLGNSDVRKLAGKATGQISLSDLRGKSSYIWEGQLTIGYSNAGIAGTFYGYNVDDVITGGLIPNKFNSLNFEKFSYVVNGVIYGTGMVIGFSGSTHSYSYIIATINNKTYKLTQSILNLYIIMDKPELLEYIKLNMGKTIPVYINEVH